MFRYNCSSLLCHLRLRYLHARQHVCLFFLQSGTVLLRGCVLLLFAAAVWMLRVCVRVRGVCQVVGTCTAQSASGRGTTRTWLPRGTFGPASFCVQRGGLFIGRGPQFKIWDTFCPVLLESAQPLLMCPGLRMMRFWYTFFMSASPLRHTLPLGKYPPKYTSTSICLSFHSTLICVLQCTKIYESRGYVAAMWASRIN
jgi:hypothetical protein